MLQFLMDYELVPELEVDKYLLLVSQTRCSPFLWQFQLTRKILCVHWRFCYDGALGLEKQVFFVNF